MTHLNKILILCILLLVGVIVALSIRTPIAVAPSPSQEVPETTKEERGQDGTPSSPKNDAGTGAGGTVTRDMRNQNLNEVPRSLFDSTNIEVLDLSENSLNSVQAEIRHLQNLRVLNLSNNKLTNIPAELGQLTALEVLNLSNNKLTGLPHELGNLQNLKTLDLRGNNYAKFDLDIIKKSLSSETVILTD